MLASYSFTCAHTVGLDTVTTSFTPLLSMPTRTIRGTRLLPAMGCLLVRGSTVCCQRSLRRFGALSASTGNCNIRMEPSCRKSTEETVGWTRMKSPMHKTKSISPIHARDFVSGSWLHREDYNKAGLRQLHRFSRGHWPVAGHGIQNVAVQAIGCE